MAFTTAEGEVIIFLLFLAVLFLAGLYYLLKAVLRSGPAS